MAANKGISVLGWEDVVRHLNNIAKSLDNPNRFGKVFLAAAVEVKAKTITKVPVLTGELKKNIFCGIRRTRPIVSAVVNIRDSKLGGISKEQAAARKEIGRRTGTKMKSVQVQGLNYYAWYVEYGTIKMRPQSFLRQAAIESVNACTAAAANELNAILEEGCAS